MPMSSLMVGNSDRQTEAMVAVHINLLNSALNGENEKSMVTRVLRNLSQIRRKLNPSLLLPLLQSSSFTLCQEYAQYMANLLVTSVNEVVKKEVTLGALAECYILLLTGLYLMDNNESATAAGLFEKLIETTESLNKRSMDYFLGKCYFYHVRSYSLSQSNDEYEVLNPVLQKGLRLSSLRHDLLTYSTIYSSLLHLFIRNGRIEESKKLLEHSRFPESSASSSIQARYHYFVAIIEGLQGNYDVAKNHATLAIRKTPHGSSAAGFFQAASKLQVVILLLTGEIPEYSLFLHPILLKPLSLYRQLCQIVRIGDLVKFQHLLNDQVDSFMKDGLLPLVQRLHHSVLIAGLKRLSQAYSKIPLTDVAQKLSLPSTEDAAFVLLKALKQGIIQGHLSLDNGQYFETTLSPHDYLTTAPQNYLHDRIISLTALNDDLIRAMRYPSDAVKQSKMAQSSNEGLPTEAELIEEYLDADDAPY